MPKIIGEVIKELVERKGLTQAQFGDKLHTTQQNVRDIYRRTVIDSDLIIAISKALDTDLLQYFYETTEPFISFRTAEVDAWNQMLQSKEAVIAAMQNEIDFLKEQNKILREDLGIHRKQYMSQEERIEELKSFNDTQKAYIAELESKRNRKL